MAVEPHSYRVLVFAPDDEKTLIETISVATEFQVSVAAWQAALRCRPGRMLHHMNGGHRMERMLAPGPAGAPPGREMILGDLREWHFLQVLCQDCKHALRLEATQIARRLGAEMPVREAERRSWCVRCKSRNTTLQVHSKPR